MFFSIKYRYWFIATLSVYTFINTAICEIYKYFQLEIHWYEALFFIFLITLITWELGRWLHPLFSRWIQDDSAAMKRKLLFFATATVCSVAATVLLVYLFETVWLKSGQSLKNPIKLTVTYVLLAGLLFHLLNAVVYYLTNFKLKEKETEQLREVNAQAQLETIKAQINPHFLFNNLNVLSALVMKNSSSSNRFIEAFSEVYRYILTQQNRELVELGLELESLKPYIYLLQQRFPESVFLNIKVRPVSSEDYIVPAALQMLVENAVKHNVISREKPLHISISLNGKPYLEVANNLQPKMSGEESSKTGLKNIRERYRLIANREIKVEKTNGYFKVFIPLLKVHSYESTDYRR